MPCFWFCCIVLLMVHTQGLYFKQGEGYEVFHPFAMRSHTEKSTYLIAPPHAWISYLIGNLRELSVSTVLGDIGDDMLGYARKLYKECLLNTILAKQFGKYRLSFSISGKKKNLRPFNESERDMGLEFPGFAVTMTGRRRLESVQEMLENIFTDNIPGDVMEAGVWRGGMSIFMRGVILAHNEGHARLSFVCDSFRGLPASSLPEDLAQTWNDNLFLEVSADTVKRNFEAFGITDRNIVIVKGFFAQSMPQLRALVGERTFSLLRLDGDMYESTVDVLYQFYDKLSLGGYVIIDDYSEGFPARAAVNDFLQVHGIATLPVDIDGTAAFWRKAAHVEVQHWRYEEKRWIA